MNTPRQVITRDLVLKHLIDPDDLDSDLDLPSSKVANSLTQIEQYLSPESGAAWDSLDNVGVWLKNLADQEQQKLDWTPEYSETIQARISEDHSDEIRGPSGSSETSDRDLKPPSGLNTEVLKRISLGLGPRPGKVEDLLTDLRESTAGPRGDTYEELSAMVQAWNGGLYTDGGRAEQRDELLRALEERLSVAASVQAGDRPQKDLDQNDTRLLSALHAFRPETAKFENQSPYAILAAMIANTRIADPDIRFDLDLWHVVLKTMLTEVGFRFESEIRRKKQIKAELASAHRTRNREEVDRLTKEKQSLNLTLVNSGSQTLLNDLKRARRNLYQKTLEELMDLTAVQAGLKSCYTSLVPPTVDVLWEACEMADAELAQCLRSQMDVLELVRANQSINIDILRNLNDDSLRRARKFAAMDIGVRPVRQRVLGERKNDVRTAEMMLKIKEETEHVRDTSKMVLERVSGMEPALEQVYEAAKGNWQADDALYSRLDSDDDVEVVEWWGDSDWEP